jgi:pyridoxine 4-dehydrogenase
MAAADTFLLGDDLRVNPLALGGSIRAPEAAAAQLRGLVEQDLRRLGRDQLDLVYLRVGGMGEAGGEPLGQRFAVLADLRREGAIRHLGLSHVDETQLAEARSTPRSPRVQNQFHIHARGDADVLARCERDGIAYVPYFPLGGGRVRLDTDRMTSVAARHQATPAQIASPGSSPCRR